MIILVPPFTYMTHWSYLILLNRDEPNLGGHAHTHHKDLSTRLCIGPMLQLHILIKPNLLLSEKEENPPNIPIVTL